MTGARENEMTAELTQLTAAAAGAALAGGIVLLALGLDALVAWARGLG